VIYLDESVLDGNPVFELRHWRRGDTLQPFGMKGSKLVSDIFHRLALLSAAKARNVAAHSQRHHLVDSWSASLAPLFCKQTPIHTHQPINNKQIQKSKELKTAHRLFTPCFLCD